MPAIVKLSIEALAEAISTMNLEEKRQLQEILEQQISEDEERTRSKKGAAARLIGIAKTDAPAPTDEEVEVMLDERLVEKYL
jgi:membrane glycosyltransferase